VRREQTADLPLSGQLARHGSDGGPPIPRPDRRELANRAAAERRRMAALTALCLVALLVGWLGVISGVLSPTAVLIAYVVSYIAGGFYATGKAIGELLGGSLSVDLLMITAALGAAAIGEWPEGAILLFLFSLSGTLEQFVLARTRRAIEALMDLTPDEAIVLRNGQEVRVPVEDLRLDEIILVRPGERIAADGNIHSGSTSIDQSALTGESMPVERNVGDPVFAGTINLNGAIEVCVTRLASETTLARIVVLVEEAQSERAQSQHLTTWFGARYTGAVLVLAALTLLVPVTLLGEAFDSSFYRAMTVLVVASPCAIVISIPAAILAAIASAARGGVLFKGGAHVESIGTIKAIAFDKTGTLTVGRPQLCDLRAASGTSPETVLQLAASAESYSEHPLASAIVAAARERGVELLPTSHLQALVGHGIRADVADRVVWIGKAELFTERGVTVPPDLALAATDYQRDGKTTMFVGDETAVIGLLAVADTVRPSAEPAIRHLRELGVERMVMLTGDNELAARAIAGRLGIDYVANLLPEDKLRVIQRLRKEHGTVAMVGDGINDAPSLASANLGISLGVTGTDVALETADVILMADDLRHLPYAVALGRSANRIIRQNLVFAFSVMLVLLFAAFFATLRLPLAVVGHEGSTVLVILNGLRLLMFRRPALQPPGA
jgi:Zn2+/Cd2+-exporting ATPase